jgi:hypothetical protein
MLNVTLSGTPTWLVVMIRSIDKFASRNRDFGAVLCAIAAIVIVVGLAEKACAGCDTIPARRQALCEQLGYQADPCRFEFDGPKVHGFLVITIDEDAPLRRATSIRLITDDVEIVQLYAPLARGSLDEVEISMFLNEHADHGAVSEADLLDVENVVNHVFYQAADEAQAAEFREAYGATGWPIIARVRSDRVELTDQVDTELASVFSVPVVVRFAIPREAR